MKIYPERCEAEVMRVLRQMASKSSRRAHNYPALRRGGNNGRANYRRA